MSIQAIGFIRTMRGGAQSRLLYCEDQQAYVVKFQNNPQHIRVLANEWLATHMAAEIGLPVPTCKVIQVEQPLIERTPDLNTFGVSEAEPGMPGLHFGSQFIGGFMPGLSMDYLPTDQLTKVLNIGSFFGALAFDKWTNNADGRQVVFHKSLSARRYKASFIDHGFCFNAGSWKFSDAPLRGIYARHRIYTHVKGWADFEPWLSRIENFPEDKLWEITRTIPFEWYEGDEVSLLRLIEQLLQRRSQVRGLVDEFRTSEQNPFPNWMCH